VLLEDARGRKFTKLVADHVFGDEHRDEGLAVVNVEGVANEVRRDRGATGPRLDRLLLSGVVELVDLVEKLPFDEGAFFERASHNS
jgi:hypothetical protein